MRLPGQQFRFLAAAAAASLLLSANASTITSAPKPTAIATETCEFRTINYITDTLPQQCLKSSWSSANGTAAVKVAEGGDVLKTIGTGDVAGNGTATDSGAGASASNQETAQSTSTGEAISVESANASPASEAAEAAATDLETGELSDTSFLSFEEWKKQTLEKAGQANANIGNKKSAEGRKRESESFQNNLDSLGEEGEIDLDFAAFRSGGNEEKRSSEDEGGEQGQEMQDVEGGGRKEQYRSKDAGKTCKERFNYASFDAGATILKTHHGAKNNKAILIENKDAYMLSECTAENKFVIIELSEDIWIDTVVLANYEFFSSMIRTFRVSVSDRYPVKIDKWKDIGTYEARNSREIQAFLITNPQIWTRYVRIEFLSHYGKEYYCPLSLVRVHGTRMLESWKETEANGDDDENDETDPGPEEEFVPDAVAEVVQIAENLKAASDEMARAFKPSEPEPVRNAASNEAKNSNEGAIVEVTPWEQHASYIFRLSGTTIPEDFCLPSEAPIRAIIEIATIYTVRNATETAHGSSQNPDSSSEPVASTAKSSVTNTTESIIARNSTLSEPPPIAPLNTTILVSNTSIPSPTVITTQKLNNTTHSRNKTTSTTSSASSLPTIQESFFKAVSRRLNFLETNSTLSLKYIEEQSRILREAFTKVEKKQLSKTTNFLDVLNSTVLDELRQFRQQYDEIWQSTVISLESQRDESRREILAISSRLNILADEVVFQKRMSIVQSVLLLLCLALVIFSRVSGGGIHGANIDVPSAFSRARLLSGFPVESPLESPGESPGYSRTSGSVWMENGQRRGMDDYEVEVPLTPASPDEREEEDVVEFTPSSGASGGEELLSGADNPLPTTTGPIESTPPSGTRPLAKSVSSNTNSSHQQSTHLEPSTPKTRTPKKRKGSGRRRSASVEDEVSITRADSTNGVSLPSILVQDATPIRKQTVVSPQPPEKAHMKIEEKNFNGLFDGVEERKGDEDLMKGAAASRLPSPPLDSVPLQTPQSQLQTNGNRNGYMVIPRAAITATETGKTPTSPRAATQERALETGSPSRTRERGQSFNIARKPLPSLPPES
ncbi:hypothetical protein WAI453_005415 [Rhynchosporium graminicola]|uniref:SUN domain-containing protein n=1 Tax=Rhynchosporium graminicola TaxID=2792576 RepID=A0A1E1L3N8_9HELO|nr:uncharacterized protein RCO7_05307 [Rhynchosporium commune]